MKETNKKTNCEDEERERSILTFDTPIGEAIEYNGARFRRITEHSYICEYDEDKDIKK